MILHCTSNWAQDPRIHELLARDIQNSYPRFRHSIFCKYFTHLWNIYKAKINHSWQGWNGNRSKGSPWKHCFAKKICQGEGGGLDFSSLSIPLHVWQSQRHLVGCTFIEKVGDPVSMYYHVNRSKSVHRGTWSRVCMFWRIQTSLPFSFTLPILWRFIL